MKNITLFTAAAIIVITAASCNQLSNKNGQSVQDAVAVGDTIGFSIAPIITDYLSLKNALVSDDDKAAASAGKELFATFTTMDIKSIPIDKHQPYMDIAESAKENAAHIGENIGNIGHQREHLALLSEDLSDLIALFGTSQPLHQARCPMFNGGKGAIWLSEAEAIKNPYYGSQMLTCGSVEKTISMH